MLNLQWLLLSSICLLLAEPKLEALAQDTLHLLNRTTLGIKPKELQKARLVGMQTILYQQLHPETIPLPETLIEGLNNLPTLSLSCEDLYLRWNPAKQKQNPSQVGPQIIVIEASEARLLRAIHSPQQLFEMMVDFWFNHFNVFSGKGLDRLWVGAYERDAIRPHVFGKFYDLLLATAQHPAMLFYLDNWQNKAPNEKGGGINENYAREVMELHTLGVDGGYTQQDVIALAKILTGWGFNLKSTPKQPGCSFYFNRSNHDFSTKRFLGKTFETGGVKEGEEALKMLASHPSTAKHISRKLAEFFISDSPPKELIDLLSDRFLKTGGDIRQVLETLFASPHFLNPTIYQKKFKTPYQYLISCVRTADVPVTNCRPLSNTLRALGMPIYGCQTPDGYKNSQEAWLSEDALLKRISFAHTLSTGKLSIDFSKKKDRTLPYTVDTVSLLNILSPILSENTLNVVQNADTPLQAELLLASPEFLRK